MSNTVAELKKELLEVSVEFYRRGWALATSGNFSARLDDQHFLITASGKDKGQITKSDFLIIDKSGWVYEPSANKPSAETLVHAAIYRQNDQIACVLHTHSVHSTMLSLDLLYQKQVVLEGYEMLKALTGVTTHDHREVVPIIANTQDMAFLSEQVSELMSLNSEAHGFLIAGHGLYTWGADVAEAKMQVEAFEFMLDCEWRRVR